MIRQFRQTLAESVHHQKKEEEEEKKEPPSNYCKHILFFSSCRNVVRVLHMLKCKNIKTPSQH